ncbi:MAG: type II secretion system GspH family protein [Candidatus Gastranaerophilales bacterium]|nr:type II secretion system GspH family protein [Candidatus Gastranaerophilales bacterium]
MKKYYGFTLSEVLITLIIIGIVAAITVPMIYANYQKEALRSAFMRTYSDLNNFAKKYYSDNSISFSEYTSQNKNKYSLVLNNMMSYFNQGGSASNMIYNTNEEDYDLDYRLKLLSGKELGKAVTTSNTICDNSEQRADLSGRLFRLNDFPAANINGPIICVDTNGLKGPNKYGYDYFVFIFTVDNRVIPMGMYHEKNTTSTNYGGNMFYSGSDYCRKTGTTSISNAACAYYALNNKSPDDESKSYWKDFI